MDADDRTVMRELLLRHERATDAMIARSDRNLEALLARSDRNTEAILRRFDERTAEIRRQVDIAADALRDLLAESRAGRAVLLRRLDRLNGGGAEAGA